MEAASVTTGKVAALARPSRIARVLLATQPDEKLAQLAGEGSDGAFEELVRRHRTALVRVAGRVASTSTAEDVVQEATLRAHHALLRGDSPDVPRAWLFTIVRRTALNERRTWKNHDALDETIDGVEQPPAAFERREEVERLVTALGDLPEHQRRAIVQRELEGRGHDEIADDLGVSAGAVRQLIFRARANLRSGFGALIPISFLRIAAFSGADQTVVGAGAGGIGITGATKIGLAAALSAGAVVGAPAVKDKVDHRPATAAAAPVPATVSPLATTPRSAVAMDALSHVGKPERSRSSGGQHRDRGNRPPPRNDQQNGGPRPQPRPREQQQPPPPTGGYHPPKQQGGNGQQHYQGAQGTQPPPPPAESDGETDGTQAETGDQSSVPESGMRMSQEP